MYSENPVLPAGSSARGEPSSLISFRPTEGGKVHDIGGGVEVPEQELDPRSLFGAAFHSARLVDNSNSSSVALERAYDDRIDAVTKAGISHSLVNPTRFSPSSTALEMGLPQHDPYEEFDRHLFELSRKHPDKAEVFKLDRSVREDAREKARNAEKRFEEVWSQLPSGFGAGYATRFAGGMAGQMYDPINLAALAAGPFGRVGIGAKELLWNAAKVGAVNAGAELVTEPFVQSWRKDAGLDYGVSHAALNVMTAFGFGVAADLGIRGAYRGLQRSAGREPILDAAGKVEGWQRPRLPLSAEEALDAAAKGAAPTATIRKAAEGDIDALHRAAKAVGVSDDPAIKGARQAAEIEDAIAGKKPGMVDEGEALDKLAQAFRHATDDAEPPASGVSPVVPARGGYERLADGGPTPPAQFKLDGKPVAFREVPAQAIGFDAERFQFKGGGNAQGVSERLLGVSQWDPIAAGRAIVYERADGSLVVADGHQRLALAKRLEAGGHEPIALPATVFREADGWTPADIRAIAARKNLQEGSGDVIDAARVIRERPDIIDSSVPLTAHAMRQARNLARLSDEAFGEVLAGRVAPNHAALVGDLVEAKAEHLGVIRALAEAEPNNEREARHIIADLLQGPREIVQEVLLGGHTRQALLAERAQVLDRALRLLKEDEKIFALLSREAERISGAGNVLAVDANALRALRGDMVSALLETVASRPGPVRTWLDEAALAVANGRPVKAVAQEFADDVRGQIEAHGLDGLKPEPPAPLRGRGIDDPVGAEAKAQIAELETALESRLKTVALKVADANVDRWFDWQRLNKRAVPSLNPVVRAEVVRLVAAGDAVPDAIKLAREQVAAAEAKRVIDLADAEAERAGTLKPESPEDVEPLVSMWRYVDSARQIGKEKDAEIAGMEAELRRYGVANAKSEAEVREILDPRDKPEGKGKGGAEEDPLKAVTAESDLLSTIDRTIADLRARPELYPPEELAAKVAALEQAKAVLEAPELSERKTLSLPGRKPGESSAAPAAKDVEPAVPTIEVPGIRIAEGPPDHVKAYRQQADAIADKSARLKAAADADPEHIAALQSQLERRQLMIAEATRLPQGVFAPTELAWAGLPQAELRANLQHIWEKRTGKDDPARHGDLSTHEKIAAHIAHVLAAPTYAQFDGGTGVRLIRLGKENDGVVVIGIREADRGRLKIMTAFNQMRSDTIARLSAALHQQGPEALKWQKAPERAGEILALISQVPPRNRGPSWHSFRRQLVQSQEDAAPLKAVAGELDSPVVDFAPGGGERVVEYGPTRIRYSVEPDGGVYLEYLRTFPEARNLGAARSAMQRFVAAADEAGKAVSLIVEGAKGVDDARLGMFYASLGFREGKDGFWRREPDTAPMKAVAGERQAPKGADKHLTYGRELGIHADMRTNFPEADFWIVRKGSDDKVGSVTREFSPEHIGVLVRNHNILPDYLYYALMHAHQQGYFKERAHGTLRSKNIKLSDAKAVPVEGPMYPDIFPAKAVLGESDGAVQRRAFDQLGFYSQALEAAKALKQAKGTPEQMRSMLTKGTGVKEAELAATGLDKFLEGKRSVTKVEIVKHLEENRVSVKEAVYRNDTDGVTFGNDPDDPATTLVANREGTIIAEISPQGDGTLLVQRRAGRSDNGWTEASGDMVVHDMEAAKKLFSPLRWPEYQIDRGNRTNRESVLHLPGRPFNFETQFEDRVATFTDSHFPNEPNPIVNTGTSIQKDGDGKAVGVLDRFQPQWAQSIRDSVRNAYAKTMFESEHQAKLADLTKRHEEADAALYELRDEINRRLFAWNPELGEKWLTPPVGRVSVKDGLDQISDLIRNRVDAGKIIPVEMRARYSKLGTQRGLLDQEIEATPALTSFKALSKKQKAAVSKAIDKDRKAGALKGGVRDEAKVASLLDQIKQAEQAQRNILDEASRWLPDGEKSAMPNGGNPSEVWAALSRWHDETPAGTRDEEGRSIVAQAFRHLNAIRHANERLGLLDAELQTAKAAVPSHPLVDTTDQAMETGLRWVVRQFIDADVDKIAISPAQALIDRAEGANNPQGMRSFYDEILPRALLKYLQSLDPSIKGPSQEGLFSSMDGRAFSHRLDHLDRPGEERGKPIQFHVFPLTEKVKAVVTEEGQPLLAAAQRTGRDFLPEGEEGTGAGAGGDWIDEHWDALSRRATAGEISHAYQSVGEAAQRVAQRIVPKSALEMEAGDLFKAARALEDSLRKADAGADEIAKAVNERFGSRVTPEEVASGKVWWRAEELSAAEKKAARGLLNEGQLAELDKVWGDPKQSLARMAELMSEVAEQPITARQIAEIALADRERFPDRRGIVARPGGKPLLDADELAELERLWKTKLSVPEIAEQMRELFQRSDISTASIGWQAHRDRARFPDRRALNPGRLEAVPRVWTEPRMAELERVWNDPANAAWSAVDVARHMSEATGREVTPDAVRSLVKSDRVRFPARQEKPWTEGERRLAGMSHVPANPVVAAPLLSELFGRRITPQEIARERAAASGVGTETKAAPAARAAPAAQSAAAAKGMVPDELVSDSLAREAINSRVAAGAPIAIRAGIVDRTLAALAPHLDLIPEGFSVGTLARIEPTVAPAEARRIARGRGGVGDVRVRAVIRYTDGSTREIEGSWKWFKGARALTFANPALREVIFFRAGLSGGFEHSLRGDLWHELVHVIFQVDTGPNRRLLDLLVDHANKLRILDMSLSDYLEKVGRSDAVDITGETLRQRYEREYAGLRSKDHRLAQEAVAHLVELIYHRALPLEDIRPIAPLLKQLFDGRSGHASRLLQGLEDGEPLLAVIGRQGRSADLMLLDAAQRMERAGRVDTEIFRLTNWYREGAGQWASERSDIKTSLSPAVEAAFVDARKGQSMRGSAEAFLRNAHQLQDYPELRGISVTLERGDIRDLPAGVADLEAGTIHIRAGTPREAAKKLVVELHRFIARREGMAEGGTPASALEVVRQAAGDLDREAAAVLEQLAALPRLATAVRRAFGRNEAEQALLDDLAKLQAMREELELLPMQEAYRRLGGTVAGRNIEQRFGWTQEMRSRMAPIESEDTPRKSQLIAEGPSRQFAQDEDEWQKELWDALSQRSHRIEQAVERKEARPDFAGQPAHAKEAPHPLQKAVAEFERAQMAAGRTVEEVAAAIEAKFGFPVDPLKVAQREVWWRVDDIIAAETGGKGRGRSVGWRFEDNAELARLHKEGMKVADMAAHMAQPQWLDRRVSRAAIETRLRQRGLVSVTRKGPLSEVWTEARNDLIERLHDDLVAKEIASAGRLDQRAPARIVTELTQRLQADIAEEAAREGRPVRRISERAVKDQMQRLGIERRVAGLPDFWSADRDALLTRLWQETPTAKNGRVKAVAAKISLETGRELSDRAVYRRLLDIGVIDRSRGQWTPEMVAMLTSDEIARLTAADAAAVLSARFPGTHVSRQAIIGKRNRLGQDLDEQLRAAERFGVPVNRILEEDLGDPARALAEAEKAMAPILDAWRYVRWVKSQPVPERLGAFLVRMGGVKDEGGDLTVRGRGGKSRGAGQQLPGLLNKGGLSLDDATLRAWEAGYLTGAERPAINDLLEMLSTDLRGQPVVREMDKELWLHIRELPELENELARYGLQTARTEAEARQTLARRGTVEKAPGIEEKGAGGAGDPAQPARGYGALGPDEEPPFPAVTAEDRATQVDRIKRGLALVEEGMSFTNAAREVGLGNDTLRRWKKRVDAGEEVRIEAPTSQRLGEGEIAGLSQQRREALVVPAGFRREGRLAWDESYVLRSGEEEPFKAVAGEPQLEAWRVGLMSNHGKPFGGLRYIPLEGSDVRTGGTDLTTHVRGLLSYRSPNSKQPHWNPVSQFTPDELRAYLGPLADDLLGQPLTTKHYPGGRGGAGSRIEAHELTVPRKAYLGEYWEANKQRTTESAERQALQAQRDREWEGAAPARGDVAAGEVKDAQKASDLSELVKACKA
jgi:hypothetical protein